MDTLTLSSEDSFLEIDRSVQVGQFSCFVKVTTVGDVMDYFPLTVKMFTAELNQTLLPKMFLFKQGVVEVDVTEFLTLSEGV